MPTQYVDVGSVSKVYVSGYDVGLSPENFPLLGDFPLATYGPALYLLSTLTIVRSDERCVRHEMEGFSSSGLVSNCHSPTDCGGFAGSSCAIIRCDGQSGREPAQILLPYGFRLRFSGFPVAQGRMGRLSANRWASPRSSIDCGGRTSRFSHLSAAAPPAPCVEWSVVSDFL